MSLRKGHFKKNMFTEEQLALEAVLLYPKIEEIRVLWKKKLLSDAEMVATYILTIIRHRHPNHSPKGTNLIEIFGSNLRSVPLAVNKMIISWLNNETDLILLEHVPSPKEVLEQQKQGKRCVTMMTNLEGLSKKILGERDALGFLIHDLQHAERFFAHHETQLGQIGFYHFVSDLYQKHEVKNLMTKDQQFCEEFEYAMSDMNAYCVHLLKYLSSAFREANKRLVGENCPFLHFTQESKNHSLKDLMTRVYHLKSISTEETLLIQNFFENYSRA